METSTSRLILGIDTGGTFTDAAICLETADSLKLITSAKSRTTKNNLTIGIRNAVSLLDPELLKQVSRVSLSTTLATNACVEDIGGDVKVVLIDSNPSTDIRLYTDCGLPEPEEIIFLPGKINVRGAIQERASREEIIAALHPVCKPGVSVAVSGIFSTRNAELELEVAEIARELGAKAICGRDVAPGQFNYIKRAATAMLNCRLQPVIVEFLDAVGQALKDLQIDVPVDIVRSDGSLMSREFAMEYPVETLLCGPAASVSGVMNLTDGQEYLIADIGGTTTDFSLVQNGSALRTKDGVNIGSYRTCVQSVFVETIGLGGDTRIYVDKEGTLRLDNNRAIPLCVLAMDYPEIKSELQQLLSDKRSIWNHVRTYEYYTLARAVLQEEYNWLTKDEKVICDYISSRPHSVKDCAEKINRDSYLFHLERLEQMGIVRKAAFTLTDVMHLRGIFTAYDAEASKEGAALLGQFFEMEEDEFCSRAWDMAIFRLYRAIIKMCLKLEHPDYSVSDETGIDRMIEKAFHGGSLMKMEFRLPCPLVGIGAAAAAFIPEVGKRLETTVILPKGAAVANAIGAAACSKRAEVSREILCDMNASNSYQVCGGGIPVAFKSYEEAVNEAKQQAEQEVRELARKRGILGNLNVRFDEQRNFIEIDTSSGRVQLDWGGTVKAVAEAEVVNDRNRIGESS